jgi:hypothetical protein
MLLAIINFWAYPEYPPHTGNVGGGALGLPTADQFAQLADGFSRPDWGENGLFYALGARLRGMAALSGPNDRPAVYALRQLVCAACYCSRCSAACKTGRTNFSCLCRLQAGGLKEG